MAQKGNVLVVVLALTCLLLVSTLADAGTERTVPASSREVVTQPKPQAHPKEMVYYPQGCRCCWFHWQPFISCGATCCGEGCTCD